MKLDMSYVYGSTNCSSYVKEMPDLGLDENLKWLF